MTKLKVLWRSQLLDSSATLDKLNYSQLSTNGHSCKQTALLTDAFSNWHFTSQLNSVFTNSRKRTLSRTLLKMKIGFFFCLCSLVSGHPMYNNWLLAMKFVFLKLKFFNKSTKIHCSLTEHQNSRDRFCQISISRASCNKRVSDFLGQIFSPRPNELNFCMWPWI